MVVSLIKILGLTASNSGWAVNRDGDVWTEIDLEMAVKSSQGLGWAKDFDLGLRRLRLRL